jgi:exodeoxyribonuclease V beta subunit
MRSFNALARSEKIGQHQLLEASAGTGKTFAIEQIVIRSLLESDNPPCLEEIAVVTFTRAATRDLRLRLRNALMQALLAIEQRETAPKADYLEAICESGEAIVFRSRQLLQQALYTFENAEICTIHAFCQHLLTDYGVAPKGDPLTAADLQGLVRDFLRSELDELLIHPIQLSRLWHSSRYRGDTEAVIRAIAELIDSSLKINPPPSFAKAADMFCLLLKQGQQQYGWTTERLIADFNTEASLYNELHSRGSKTLKPAWQNRVARVASLLTTPSPSAATLAELIEEGLPWLEAFIPEKRVKRSKPLPAGSLNYPDFTRWLKDTIWPILQPQSSEHHLLAQLAAGCQQLMRRYTEQEERYTYDDLLSATADATLSPDFCQAIRQRYRLVIVDEFQDTDPLQWKILEHLFLVPEWQGALYLVGDPKQSIYAFRQADIYTYLQAASSLGPTQCASLDTNYRSHPLFIAALNRFFNGEQIPNLIHLPATNKSLPYRPVHAGRQASELTLVPSSEVGISLLLSPILKTAKTAQIKQIEEEVWLPYIAAEIHRLKKNYGVEYRQCAILVRDRYQSSRVAAALKKYSIPVVQQRTTLLAEAPAVAALRELISAVLRPYDLAALKIALGGRLLAWSYTDILTLNNPQVLENTLINCSRWRKKLQTEGVASFLQAVLESSDCQQIMTIGERLLATPDGELFFQDLWQLVELIINWQNSSQNSSDLLNFFEALPELDSSYEDFLHRQHTSNDGVLISTIHASKGLEYAIVFAIGLSMRTPSPKPFKTHNLSIIPIEETSEAYLEECRENDAEKLRQLYVAVTRAKYRLYLFSTTADDTKPSIEPVCLPGQAAPLELYLAQLCMPDEEDHYPFIGKLSSKTIDDAIVALPGINAPLTTQLISTVDTSSIEPTSTIVPKLCTPTDIAPLPVVSSPVSFSRLQKQLSSNHAHITPSAISSESGEYLLPSGTAFGSLMHLLLQKVPWNSALDNDCCRKALKPYIAASRYAAWEDSIIDMVKSAFNALLPAAQGSFTLNEVKEELTYREIEFLGQLTVSEAHCKGIIDLIFMHNGYYYLIDWKSHFLGADIAAYSPERLAAVVEHHGYEQQMTIYTQALKRYLAIIEPRPFEACFGAAFVVFLRGLMPGSSSGIYSIHN